MSPDKSSAGAKDSGATSRRGGDGTPSVTAPEDDKPTAEELAEMVVRDLWNPDVRRAFYEQFPLDTLRDELAELAGEEPQPSFTLAEMRAPNASAEAKAALAAMTKEQQEELAFRARVESDKFYKRARMQADRELVAEEAGSVELPALQGLDAFLARPADPVRYRVESLWPRKGRVVLAAQQKAGKTTLVGNLVRSLVDGAPFLDRFATERVARVVLLDDEMSDSQLQRWYQDFGIRNPKAAQIATLRGRLASFNILDPVTRSRWAQRIGPADVLIFDCLRPVLDALGLDPNSQAGLFLTALDELCGEAGIPEAVVVHHMGHTQERAANDARIIAWPEANWKLLPTLVDGPGNTREVDERGPRYFTAYGRDVDQPTIQIAMNPDRTLYVSGGSRAQEASTAIELAILSYLEDEAEPPSTTALETAMVAAGFKRDPMRVALARLVRAGQLVKRRRSGQGAGFEYLIPEVEEDVL